MKSIIEIMKSALPCPVYANETDSMKECVTYDFNTSIFNGARKTARMKVHLRSRSMERGLELEGILDAAIVKVGEKPLSQTVTSCERNGGGWLQDGDWHVRIAYYDIIMRA